jgi:uncharacterized lipoprotein YddW (UPF0748 family)
MVRIRVLAVFIGMLPAMLFAAGEVYHPVAVTPPAPVREMRGAWITAVATNADWPSEPGLGVAEQKAELIALLNHAAQMKLNAVFFQVRPTCDALYASPFEPWSEYITGTMGKAPQPLYDPLTFAVEEAHKRGLELHAWFNPFRASRLEARSPVSPNHVTRTHPEWICRYGGQAWLDPGEPAAREYVLQAVLDVVKRYDVDGVVFDDYFYPYPKADAAGRVLSFPDDASWRKYGLPGGLARDDWRRQNVNAFIQKVYQSIKAAKTWVKFGASPFGIWRPGHPWQIKGLDTYAGLYADSRLWLANGWLDYFAPQLYWPIDPPQQSFPILLNWWTQQNAKGRNLWAGLNAVAVGKDWSANEIARQLSLTRRQPGASGEIFYHLRTIAENPALNSVVRAEYTQAALVPASPWLASSPPAKPNLSVTGNSDTGRSAGLSVHWGTGGETAWLWVLQYRTNEVWTTEILPGRQTARTFEKIRPEIVVVSAVDRVGNMSSPAAIKKSRPVHSGKNVMILN